jgi:hypothetical protein
MSDCVQISSGRPSAPKSLTGELQHYLETIISRRPNVIEYIAVDNTLAAIKNIAIRLRNTMKHLYPPVVSIMFAGFFCLFSCTKKSKQENGLPKRMQEQGAKSVEAFKNRTIHKILTTSVIDDTPDDDLLQVVFDNLYEKLPADYEKEYATVLGWNTSRQAIYMIWLLEGEVNNGGYNQFYFNSGGQFYKHLPDALQRVNAMKTADLTLAANNTYEKYSDNIKKHQDGTLEGFSKSYEDNPLNAFDEQFYALSKIENLQKLQVKFIRKHKSDFSDQ